MITILKSITLAVLIIGSISSMSFAEKADLKNDSAQTIMPQCKQGFCRIQMFKNSKKQEAAAGIKLEADYILQCQYIKEGDPASGAINNVYGEPTWIVPRENALAILGLLEAYKATKNKEYLERSRMAADYLVRIQDSDGAWFNQYGYTTPGDINNPSNTEALSKSPTQTSEVMLALFNLGYSPAYYEAMKKGAQYLLSCQDPQNKTGLDDGLVSGGKDAEGNYSTWRWASDNAFSYQALMGTAKWARRNGDREFAQECELAAADIISGINEYLYIDDTSRSDYGVWYRTVDANANPVNPDFHDWINYAPQMLDVPAKGVGSKRVGEWIHQTFQQEDGSVVWNDGSESTRKSPGYSFQAMLVWLDLKQYDYASQAMNWAKDSGLWQKTADSGNVAGGWIDWIEGANPAPSWQRFIDTSFYYTAARLGGYDFRTWNKRPRIN